MRGEHAELVEMANDTLRVMLFLGSTRVGRIGGRVGRWARTALEARGHTVETVDPLLLSNHVDSDSQMYPMRRPFFFYPEGKAPSALEQLACSVQAADAYVMVTPVMTQGVWQIAGSQPGTLIRYLLVSKHSSTQPSVLAPQEYNHAPAPALLETLNHFGSSSFAFKPSCIVTYSAGQWGGTRAAVGLRTVLAELGCLPISAMIHIPHAGKLFAPDGSLTDIKDQERWGCVHNHI